MTNIAREKLGFRYGEKGTHTSRTIMSKELDLLLSVIEPAASREEYKRAIIEENVLGKRTEATRRLSAQRLSELYGLDPSIPVFRMLRFLWDRDSDGRPLIAFLCAYARDPLLRLTAPAILEIESGTPVSSANIDQVLFRTLEDRFNPSILNKISRNAASSWTQSGHLSGRAKKTKSEPVVTAGAVAFALFLGYLEGRRAKGLLESEWLRVLEISLLEVDQLILKASQRGFLEYRFAG